MLTDIQRRAVVGLQEEGRMRFSAGSSQYKAPSLAQALSQRYKDTLDTLCTFTEFKPPAICSPPVEGHSEQFNFLYNNMTNIQGIIQGET